MQGESSRKMTNVCKISAGIVSYNPSVERLQRVICSIIEQVDTLIIVDNGSANVSDLKQMLLKNRKIFPIFFLENKGIAKALNIICKTAKEKDYQWVLTLDQDTICPSDIIMCLSKAINYDRAGIICPAVIYEGRNLVTSNKEKEIEEDNACMTSASLTNINAWEISGGFNDDYFIDFVDNDFCMKLRLHNYRILRVNSCSISHQLGDSVSRNFLWRTISGTSHKPWRIYYMIRNNLLFIFEYKHHLNIVKEYLKVVYVLCVEFFFSSKKREVMFYAWKGFKAALNHKKGKMK